MSFQLTSPQLQIIETIEDPRAMIRHAVKRTREACKATEDLSSDDEDEYDDEVLEYSHPTIS